MYRKKWGFVLAGMGAVILFSIACWQISAQINKDSTSIAHRFETLAEKNTELLRKKYHKDDALLKKAIDEMSKIEIAEEKIGGVRSFDVRPNLNQPFEVTTGPNYHEETTHFEEFDEKFRTTMRPATPEEQNSKTISLQTSMKPDTTSNRILTRSDIFDKYHDTKSFKNR